MPKKRYVYNPHIHASAQERPYATRPSRSQQLRNPKLVPKLTNDALKPLEKKGVADEELAKIEAERARKRELEERDDDLVERDSRQGRLDLPVPNDVDGVMIQGVKGHLVTVTVVAHHHPDGVNVRFHVTAALPGVRAMKEATETEEDDLLAKDGQRHPGSKDQILVSPWGIQIHDANDTRQNHQNPRASPLEDGTNAVLDGETRAGSEVEDKEECQLNRHRENEA
ncbi:hypothetical protein PT974_11265 [Cladobotryum mycophilum]|uniref:Uncharacterized protein n=1 Tax=Cladobotryum mycophilum TaxID=491253 RepID=A0ABR0S4R0_9HYPO